jgi:predicted nucleic acid-binding Zn ribbon protein
VAVARYKKLVRHICQEVLRFVRQDKKWWLIPLVVFVLILVGLVLFTQGPAPLSPFMYSR